MDWRLMGDKPLPEPAMTLIEVSKHAYSSYQAFSLPFIFYHVIFQPDVTDLISIDVE